MLDKLKKYFKPEEEEVKMTTEAKQAEMSVETLTAELSELKANFAQVSETLAAAQAAQESTAKELEAAKAALATIAEQKATAEAVAHAAKMAKRQAAVEANIGTEKAAAFMEATKGLDDTAFAAICSAMAGSAKAEAESELFKEVGVETKAEAKAEPQVTHFKQYIKKEKK